MQVLELGGHRPPGWRLVPAGLRSTRSLSPGAELRARLPIGAKPLGAGVGQRVLEHLPEHLAGHGGDLHPRRAAVITCSGWRIEAAMISEVTPVARKQSTISATTAPESTEMSSRPTPTGDVGRTGAGGERGLVGGEDQRHVHRDAGHAVSAWVAASPASSRAP